MPQLERFQSDKKLAFSHTEWLLRFAEQGFNYPITLEVDPTNKCPLNCSYCVWRNYLDHDKSSLDQESLERIVREASVLGVKSIIWTGGGEPLSNPFTVSAVRLSSTLGMSNAMFTTAVPMTLGVIEQLASNLDWIRFHLDGATPKTYANSHGVSEKVFETATNNIVDFVEYKKKQQLSVSCGMGTVALKSNIDEVSHLALLAKQLGLDYFQYKPDLAQISKSDYLYWWNTQVVPKMDELSTLLIDDYFTLQYNNQTDEYTMDQIGRCYIHHALTAVTADGRVSFCKSLRDDIRLSLGNISECSLKGLFDSERHLRLCQTVTPLNCQIVPCPNKAANEFIDQTIKQPKANLLAMRIPVVEHSQFI